jgi:hypothetical protein
MNKYLVLKFRDARLFMDKGDYIVDYNIEYKKPYPHTENRMNYGHRYFEEPMTIYQLSNMIHVIFGERPVPTHRSVPYEKNEYLFEKTKNSFLKYTDHLHKNELVTSFHKIKNKQVHLTEFKKLAKGHFNSTLKNPNVNWETLKLNFINEQEFNKFTEKCDNLLNISSFEHKLIDVREMIIEKNILNGFNYLTENSKTTTIYSYLKTGDGTYLTGKTITSLKNTNGIGKCSIFHGFVVVPINDNDLLTLEEKSKGTASLLDGGHVFIDKIILENEINLNNYLKISDISTKQI